MNGPHFTVIDAEWPLLLRNLQYQQRQGVLPPELLGLLQRLENFAAQQQSNDNELDLHSPLVEENQCWMDTEWGNSEMCSRSPFLPFLDTVEWSDASQGLIRRAWFDSDATQCAPPSLLFQSMEVDSWVLDQSDDVLMTTNDKPTPSVTLIGSLSPRSSMLPFSPTSRVSDRSSPSSQASAISPLLLSPSLPPHSSSYKPPVANTLAGCGPSNVGPVRKGLRSSRRMASDNPYYNGNGNGDPAPAKRRRCRRGGQIAQARHHSPLIGPEQLGGKNDLQSPEDPDNPGDGNAHEGLQGIGLHFDGPVPEVLPLSLDAIPLLGALASAARDFIYRTAGSEVRRVSGLVTNVPAVMEALIQGQPEPVAPISNPQTSETEYHALVTLVERCKGIELRDACLQLTYLVHALILAAQVNRMMLKTQKAKYTVFKELEAYVISQCPEIASQSDTPTVYSRRTLDRYFMDGMSIAALCGAGSFYILILLACSRARVELRKLDGTMVNRLAKLIRCPTDTPEGRSIKEDIIPAIAHMRQLYPLRLEMVLPSTVLDELFLPESGFDTQGIQKIDCGNIQITDQIIDKIAFHDFVKDRDWDAWYPTTVPIQDAKSWTIDSLNHLLGESHFPKIYCLGSTLHYQGDGIPLPKWNMVPELPDLITISTPFKPNLKANIQLPYGMEDQERYQFTEQHRGFAHKAHEAMDIQDFVTQLQKQLTLGKKYRLNKYLRLDGNMIDGKMLRINDANNNLLVLILANMPPYLRKRLMDIIGLAYQERLKYCDTKTAGQNHVFDSIHFSYYNRYSKRGDGTSDGVDPAAAVQNPQKQRVSTAQFVPRTSKEMQAHSNEYQILHEGLEPVFRWVESMMEHLLPNNVAVLKIALEALPCSHTSPIYPFAGYVVNLNVSTRAHRDLQDKDICLVLVISDDCQGGELCLVEPGLVLGLRNGDAVVFSSTKITHFNSHFIGRRVSLVFQTDRHLDTWVQDFNGWDHIITVTAITQKT